MAYEHQDAVSDAALERLFAEAREATPLPPASLLARIEADAARMQPRSVAVPAQPPKWVRAFDWLSRLAMPGSLATAALVGLWIGVSFGDQAGVYGTAMLDGTLGLQVAYDYPALAGLIGE